MQVQGLSQTPDTPVCSDSDFGFHDPGNFSTSQKGYFIERGLGRMEEGGRKRRRYVGYDFHELRHTQATFLIGNGIDPKSVQGRLGHEVSSMTMDVYARMMGGTTAKPPISWRSSAGRARPSPSTGAGSPSWRGRLRADVATTKHTPSLTSGVIAAGPAGDKAQDDKMLSTQERPHL